MNHNYNKTSVWPFLLLLACGLRLFTASLGHNYDMESWAIVADIGLRGEVVYAETNRYNYGPLWAFILTALRQLQALTGSNDINTFHLWVVAWLSLVDIATAEMLRKLAGMKAALLLLFNPVSLALTGFHSQMEAMAIFWAWAAWLWMQRDAARYWMAAAFLMGLSLIQKHLFLFFPFWVLFDTRLQLKQRLFFGILTYSIFALGFLPFLTDEAARTGILRNVFGYNSTEGVSLIPMLLGKIIGVDALKIFLDAIPIVKGYKFIFILLICIAGYISVRRRPDVYFYLYLLLLLALSSAFANQYLAIPILALVLWYRSPETWIYLFVAGGFLWLRAPHAPASAISWLNSIYEFGGLLTIKKAIFSAYAAQAVLLVFWVRLVFKNEK